MNPIIGNIEKAISSINEIIGSISPRSATTIKQAFFMFVFFMAMGGVIIGYNMGKGSAQKTGIQIADSTNAIFDSEMRGEHRDGVFRTMLDSELVSEIRESRIGKIDFPSNSRMEPEVNDALVEPETPERGVTPPPSLEMRDRISTIDRFDTKDESAQVGALKRRPLEKPESGMEPAIMKEDRSERVMDVRKSDMPEPGVNDIRDDDGAAKPRTPSDHKAVKRPVELSPIEKQGGVLEK